jgi:hypothetical protein
MYKTFGHAILPNLEKRWLSLEEVGDRQPRFEIMPAF